MTANLDRYSAGRLVPGIGIGWAEEEFAALKIPYAERGRITDEYLAALHTLWSEDIASFEGTHTSFHNVHTAPRPLQSPRPPLWIGGNSPAAIRRAARHGDTWHPLGVTPPWLEKQGLPALRAAAEQAARPTPTVALRTPLRVTTTPIPDADRLPGEGTLPQIETDLATLATLGIAHVLLDPRYREPTRLQPPETDRTHLEAIAPSSPPTSPNPPATRPRPIDSRTPFHLRVCNPPPNTGRPGRKPASNSRDARYRAMVPIATFLGLRLGEPAGLRSLDRCERPGADGAHATRVTPGRVDLPKRDKQTRS